MLAELMKATMVVMSMIASSEMMVFGDFIIEAWAHFAPVGLVCAPDVTVAHDLSRWELLLELVE